MNPSHSPTLSIADSLRTPSKATGPRADQSSAGKGSDSFNTLYHKETASAGDGKLTKDNNFNSLDNRNGKTDKGPLVVDEPILEDDMDEIPALAKNDLAREDQPFDIELLHGISVALPSNSTQTKVGEKFPLSGKELPPAEPELGQVLTKSDSGIEIRGRSDISERSDRLRQDKLVDLSSSRSGLSVNDNRLDAAQSKVLSEPFAESLSLLASKPLQDPATVLTTGNNSPASLAAVVSQTDSTAAHKLSLAADAAANTDLNANARSSIERSSALGEKIHWMHNAKISTAELHLHPAELGAIEIKIVTEDQQARVSFITSSAAARDVIEESLPKLRELLADSGLALDQSDISQKENGDEPTQRDQQASPENLHIERELDRQFTASPISTRIGQVDHYV